MTTQEINNRIEFYTNLFIDTVRNFVNTNTDAIEAGRLALQLVGCPKVAAEAIEAGMMSELNK